MKLLIFVTPNYWHKIKATLWWMTSCMNIFIIINNTYENDTVLFYLEGFLSCGVSCSEMVENLNINTSIFQINYISNLPLIITSIHLISVYLLFDMSIKTQFKFHKKRHNLWTKIYRSLDLVKWIAIVEYVILSPTLMLTSLNSCRQEVLGLSEGGTFRGRA